MSNNIITVETTGGPSATVDWIEGMSGQAALEAAWSSINNTEKFTFGLQYYGSQLGYMVFMINETFDSFVSSSQPFYYWHLFVNDTPATMGIDGIRLNPGNHMRFSFDRYIPTQHAGTIMEAKFKFQTSKMSNK